MKDLTRILSAIEQGDPQAAEQLLPLVYDELRQLAAQKLIHEKLAHLLPTVRSVTVRPVGESWGATRPRRCTTTRSGGAGPGGKSRGHGPGRRLEPEAILQRGMMEVST